MKTRRNKKDDEEFSLLIDEWNDVFENYKIFPTPNDFNIALNSIYEKFGWTEKDFDDYRNQLRR